MPIEVRQLVINSNVLQKSCAQDDSNGGGSKELKEEILEECKQLVLEMLREEKER